MTDIGFQEFKSKLKTELVATQCPIKKAIAQQISNIGSGSNWQDSIVFDAIKIAGLDWNRNAASLIESLHKGAGNKDVALALHYWLHSQPERLDRAEYIDRKILRGQTFFEKYGVYVFDFERVIPEDEENLSDGDTKVSLSKVLRSRWLEDATTHEQEYPCLILLLSEIETIMGTLRVKYFEQDGLFNVRSILDQQDWIDSETIDEIWKNNPKIDTWSAKYGKVTEFIDNRRYVLVRRDGARIATDALHEINSWFIKIHRLFEDGVIQERNIDLFMRYLMVFAGFNHSVFFKFYFVDDANKIDEVLKRAVKRAKDIKLDLRDYAPLDRQYQDIYATA